MNTLTSSSDKRALLLCFFLMFLLHLQAQELFIGTYNIRNQNQYDVEQGNGWEQRLPVICEQLNFLQPAVFGAQEVLVGQLHDMLRLMPEYDAIGVGREDGKEEGEYAAIFYHKKQLKLLESGHFWLNQQPDQPIKGWDAACVRICTWAKFRDQRTKKKFIFFTTHMDHVGIIARREGAKLIIKKVEEIAKGLPVIITGDFNVDQNNEIFSILENSPLLKDAYNSAEQRFMVNGTFNSFNPNLYTQSRLDHVFVSPSFTVTHYASFTNIYWKKQNTETTQKGHDAPQEIDLSTYIPRCPSDHYPVFVKLLY